MAKKTTPCPAYPKWSSAKYWGFLRSGLRSLSRRWPPIYDCLNASKRKYSGPNKLQKWEYQCASCRGWFKRKEVSVDHITPAGALSAPEHIAPFVEKLFCGVNHLQTLCKTCHNTKTASERKKEKQ